MPLALVKVGYLFVKGAARPISLLVTRYAKKRAFFRRACVSAAQKMHWMEVRLRKLSGDPKVHRVKPLEEHKAIEIGGSIVNFTNGVSQLYRRIDRLQLVGIGFLFRDEQKSNI